MSFEWMDRGLCREVGMAVFFPTDNQSGKAAVRVCKKCPVREQCLELALQRDEHGVWGGTTRYTRLKMQKEAAA